MKEKSLKFPHIEQLIMTNELIEFRDRLIRVLNFLEELVENNKTNHKEKLKVISEGYQITLQLINQLINCSDQSKLEKKSIS